MLEVFQLLAVSNAIIKSFKLLKILPNKSDENDHKNKNKKHSTHHYVSPLIINDTITSLKLWVALVLFRLYSICFEKYVSWIPGYFYIKSFFVLMTLFPQLKVINFLYDEILMLAYSYIQYKIEEFAVTSSHDFIHKFMLLLLLIFFPHFSSQLEIIDTTAQSQTTTADLSISDNDEDEEDEISTAILLQSNRKTIFMSIGKDKDNEINLFSPNMKYPQATTPHRSQSDEHNMSPNRQHISLLDNSEQLEQMDTQEKVEETISNVPSINTTLPRSASVSRRITQSQKRLSQLSPYLQRLRTQFRLPSSAHKQSNTTSSTTTPSTAIDSSTVKLPHSSLVNTENNITHNDHTSTTADTLIPTALITIAQISSIDPSIPITNTELNSTDNVNSESSMLDQSTIILDRTINSTYVSTTSPHFLRRLTRSTIGNSTSASRRPSGAAVLSRNLFGDFMKSMSRTSTTTSTTNINRVPSSSSSAKRISKSARSISPGMKIELMRSESSQRSGSSSSVRGEKSTSVNPVNIIAPPIKPPRVQSASRTQIDNQSTVPFTSPIVSASGNSRRASPSTISRITDTDSIQSPCTEETSKPLSLAQSPSLNRESPARTSSRKKWQ